MKKLFALATAVGALVLAPGAWAGQVVQITAGGFVPSQVAIPVDDTITWTNKDTVDRQVVADAGEFKSQVLKPGQSYTYNFPAAGSYRYKGGIKQAQRGVVNVRRVEATAVTIGVSRRIVRYGQPIMLSGSIGSGEGGKLVRVFMTPYRGVQTSKTTLTDAEGTWSMTVKPAIRTEYYAELGNVLSRRAPFVYVRPNLKLRVKNAAIGQFVGTAKIGRQYAGKFVHLQRRLANGSFRTIDVARLGKNGIVQFRSRLRQGRNVLRLRTRPAPGYLAGFSNRVTVNR
jgi:plastocyanin